MSAPVKPEDAPVEPQAPEEEVVIPADLTSTSLVEIMAQLEEAEAAEAEAANPKPAEKSPEWDKERQRRDEEHAAERRRLQADLEAKERELADLRNRTQAAPAPGVPPVPPEDEDKDLELPEVADVDDLARALPRIVKRMKAIDTETQRLKAELKKREELDAQRSETAEATANETALQAHIDGRVKAFGEEQRGAITAEVNRILTKEWGYEPGEFPAPSVTRSVVADAVERLALTPKNPARKPAGNGGGAPNLDSTRGGLPPAKRVFTPGTPAEVEARMRKTGKYK